MKIWQMVLCGSVAAMLSGVVSAQTSTGLDCSKAVSTTAKMVCSDKGLAALDGTMSDLYRASGQSPEVIAQQRRDLFRSDQCSAASDARACVESAYHRRIIALEIEQKKAGSAKSATLDCGAGKKALKALFYNGTEPASVMLIYGNDHAVALVAMSGSGSRYTAPGIEYWEHQGEAAVTWRGAKMTCRVVR
jgi:uncharacterized protein